MILHSTRLRAARDLISTPERWKQGAYARTAKGKAVRRDHPNAVCWCATAGFQSIYAPSPSSFFATLGYLNRAVGMNFIEWQDAPGRTHAEVMAAMGDAIAQAEAEGC